MRLFEWLIWTFQFGFFFFDCQSALPYLQPFWLLLFLLEWKALIFGCDCLSMIYKCKAPSIFRRSSVTALFRSNRPRPIFSELSIFSKEFLPISASLSGEGQLASDSPPKTHPSRPKMPAKMAFLFLEIQTHCFQFFCFPQKGNPATPVCVKPKEGAKNAQRCLQKSQTKKSQQRVFLIPQNCLTLQYNLKMGFNTFSGMLLCLIVLSLAAPSLQLNWQGTGNMNATVMGTINSLITNNPVADSSNEAAIDHIATTIATALDTLWDPAWYVIMNQQKPAFDTVVYGYAFNNHWMWINGVPITDSPTFIWAYIIWKDYNCPHRMEINAIKAQMSTFTPSQSVTLSGISAQHANLLKTDIWSYAHNLVTDAEAAFGTGAFTIIASQDPEIYLSGSVCLYDNNWDNTAGVAILDGQSWGSYYLFHTRYMAP